MTKGIYFREGDELHIERVSDEELLEAAKLLHKNSKNLNPKIIFFDLDEANFNIYTYEFLDQILDSIF